MDALDALEAMEVRKTMVPQAQKYSREYRDLLFPFGKYLILNHGLNLLPHSTLML
jgi:hypothetical protein